MHAPLRLRLVAFICGASIMALEMVGVRILEPYFGSTHYVWGSIIGIFLGALSLGYYLGGRVADRAPRIEVLGHFVLAAAILIFLVPWMASGICTWLVRWPGLDPRLQALLGSILLYAAPSILLGMVSPFAVRLAARQLAGVGSVAGELYAISTLGSICGTLLVSFVLQELLGSFWIVWCIGATLVVVVGLCYWGRWRARTVAPAAAAVVAFFCGWAGVTYAEAREEHSATGRINRRLLHGGLQYGGEEDVYVAGKESVYHRIAVVDSVANMETQTLVEPGKRARYMLFNNQIESGIVIEENVVRADETVPTGYYETATGYVRHLHLGVLFTQDAPRNVLVIGGGGGVGPQAFTRDYAGAIELIDTVDIDPWVFRFAEMYFGYPRTHPVMKSHVMDGRQFVRLAERTYDYVIMDAYTSGGRIPRHLISQEFFRELRTHMEPGGVMLANIISGTKGRRGRLMRSIWKTLTTVFDQVYVFPRQRAGAPAENVFIIGTTDEAPRLSRSSIELRYNRLRGTLLKQRGLQQAVENYISSPPEFGDVPLLTDDYCPTDSMAY